MNIPINLLVLLLMIFGVIMLQVYLSKKEVKWLGLVLPGINVLFSVIAVLGIASYGNETPQQILLKIFTVFLIYNMPTGILMAIYFACREKRKNRREIEIMNIQDLD